MKYKTLQDEDALVTCPAATEDGAPLNLEHVYNITVENVTEEVNTD